MTRYTRGIKPFKDPYHLPKNLFQPKPREYYASKTSYKLPVYLRKKLKEYLKKPQPRFNPKDYLIVCCNISNNSKEHQDLANFIWSIAPDRRKESGRHYVYLVKRPKGTTITYAINPSTKDQLLPIIYEAIEKEIL